MNTIAVLATEDPAMEGALETVPFDHSPYPEVGPDVGTVGVQDVNLTVIAPEHSQSLPHHL